MRNKKGVSIIELLIVIAIISVIGVTVIPIGAGFLERNTARNKVNEVVESLRVARINAMSGKNDSQWGTTVTASEIVLFQGDSYATRNPDYDISYSVPQSVNITTFEVIFDEITGNPNQTLTINIISDLTSRVVQLNELGVVNVN